MLTMLQHEKIAEVYHVIQRLRRASVWRNDREWKGEIIYLVTRRDPARVLTVK